MSFDPMVLSCSAMGLLPGIEAEEGIIWRPALDKSTQTNLSESVTAMQYDLVANQTEVARLTERMQSMKNDMKAQVEELWRLRVSAQSTTELHLTINTLQHETKNLQRQMDMLITEKDTLIRQNTFLQQEADRLVSENARILTADRMRLMDRMAADASRDQQRKDDLTMALAAVHHAGGSEAPGSRRASTAGDPDSALPTASPTPKHSDGAPAVTSTGAPRSEGAHGAASISLSSLPASYRRMMEGSSASLPNGADSLLARSRLFEALQLEVPDLPSVEDLRKAIESGKS